MHKKKLLLLHGWGWRKYPCFAPAHQWEDRQRLLDYLAVEYEIDFPAIPGFDAKESSPPQPWTLDDYAQWLDGRIHDKHYDAVLGYSFGCAIATHWLRTTSSSSVPLVLVSPAVTRAYRKSAGVLPRMTARLLRTLHLDKVITFLRELYLRYWIKNPNVIYGTPFLVGTYSNIVKVDLAEELQWVFDNHRPVLCVFGTNDTATPPELLFSKVPIARSHSVLIPDAGHNIGTTHPEKIASATISFLDDCWDHSIK